LAESRLTFRQGHTVQPFAMVCGEQGCRYDVYCTKKKTININILWRAGLKPLLKP